MERKEIRILKDDIEVPAVVLEKADAAFAQIKKERAGAMKNKNEKNKVRKFVKPVIAAAACALLFAGIGVGNHFGNHAEEPAAESENGQEEMLAADETMQTQENWFTMTAYAKELEPGKPVPLTNMGNSGRSYVLGGSDNGNVNYCISTEFLCQGDNIERVSYSINRGAFQIVQPADVNDRIIVDGQPFPGELNTGSIGGGWDEAIEEPQDIYESALYQSFTLDYDVQSAAHTWINICNECPDSGAIKNLIWGEGGEGKTLEEMSDGINRLLADTVITCTAYYTDGTSQSVDIAVGSKVMTYEEAGEPAGEDEIPQDTKAVFIIFEVK